VCERDGGKEGTTEGGRGRERGRERGVLAGIRNTELKGTLLGGVEEEGYKCYSSRFASTRIPALCLYLRVKLLRDISLQVSTDNPQYHSFPSLASKHTSKKRLHSDFSSGTTRWEDKWLGFSLVTPTNYSDKRTHFNAHT